MSEYAKWDDLTAAEREAFIRSKIATVRKAWPILLDPPASHAARRPAPGSRIPTNADALSLRAEIASDAAYWLKALLEDHPEALREDARVDAADTYEVLSVLMADARWMSGWAYGKRLAFEFADHAVDASAIAWPRDRGTVLLGECPNTVGAEGVPVTCGRRVRAKPGHEGDIKCKGCGKTDTIDGWMLAMVGHEKPVTIPQLRLILHKRLGIAVDERTLRRWHKAEKIKSIAGSSEGKPLFDRRDVIRRLMAEEEERRLVALHG